MIRSVGPAAVVVIDEVTKVGEARRWSVELAARLGFNETEQGKVALVVTEAASNLLKHAGGGQLILEGFHHEQFGSHLEVLALDSGKGMSDLTKCMTDGYSSAGSPGEGLGAISRIADRLEIYTTPKTGTVLWARLDSKPRHGTHGRPLELGVVKVCAPGEQECGDDWASIERDDHQLILLADGLGHGPEAAAASGEAVRAFFAQRSSQPSEILEAIHRSIRGTRGAAMAIARIDLAESRLRYAGVGNISSLILDTNTGATTSMVSLNGTVGHTIRKIQSFDYPCDRDSVVIMHSDGLATHWSLDRYPGIKGRYPSLIAGALFRDHKRGRDDVSVVVARSARGE